MCPPPQQGSPEGRSEWLSCIPGLPHHDNQKRLQMRPDSPGDCHLVENRWVMICLQCNEESRLRWKLVQVVMWYLACRTQMVGEGTETPASAPRGPAGPSIGNGEWAFPGVRERFFRGRRSYRTGRGHNRNAMCPVPSSVHREPICCECQAKFGGRLPVRRAEAVLPYWVPLSLRPQKQIQKMVWFYVPQTTKACPCPCHHFGGRLTMPRDQAVMPYWVPQVLRSHKKVVKRQQSFKGIPVPLDVRSGYNRWRICGEGRRLLKWQQLQALHQAALVSPGQPASLLASLLPLSLSLLILVQALLSVIVAIW
ncbi:PREDICTED: uncharacterized protein LOC103076336 [Lipotes vexillifer]|uniref:Uncharacterized protein LOC103076336 n=1 Tax=Lipotes vexillifer TaxID=118797 RepID=A0A340Y5K2_LIPVE|nr:PREDICTED: uncharacterized protein LOC103076336 [Lipotes vexillifer]